MNTLYLQLRLVSCLLFVQPYLSAPTVGGNSATKLVDLTWTNSDSIPQWPTSRRWTGENFFAGVIPAPRYGKKDLFVSVRDLCSSEHTGTHIDAPYHFSENGWRADEIPVESFIRPAVKWSLPEIRTVEENDTISVLDLQKMSSKWGFPPNKSILVIETGWWKRSGSLKSYVGTEVRGEAGENLQTYPSMTPESAAWMEENVVNIAAIGSDTLSLDGRPGLFGFPTHLVYLMRNIYIIENLHRLDLLPATGHTMMVLPLKIANGTGAPARVLAAPAAFFDEFATAKLAANHTVGVWVLILAVVMLVFQLE